MKFTEEEAYEKIVSKLTNNGKKPLQASERTLKHLLTKYYKKFADDETEIDDFVTNNVDDFEEVNGNVNKDKADFIKQYQEEHKVVEPKAKQTDKPIDKPNDGSESVLDKLQAQLAELIEDREKTKKANAIASKRNDLLTKMEEKGIKDKEWANDFIREINITEDFDVDAKADAYLKIYNKSQVQKVTPPTPADSANNKDISKALTSQKEAREKYLKEQGLI